MYFKFRGFEFLLLLFQIWTLSAVSWIKHHSWFMRYCDHWPRQDPVRLLFIPLKKKNLNNKMNSHEPTGQNCKSLSPYLQAPPFPICCLSSRGAL